METEGWQIAFLSTSRHNNLPAVIDIYFSVALFFLIIEYLFVRHLVFVFQSKFFFNIPV